MSTDLVAVNPIKKITKDSYDLAEKHFSGIKHTSRETYLDEIVKLVGEYLESDTISDDVRAQFETYKIEFAELRNFVVRTDEQSHNEFSNLGKKSNRHSNAFFAVAIEMLKAELEFLHATRTPRASIKEEIEKTDETLVDHAPENENNMIVESPSEIAAPAPSSDQPLVVLQAKVAGLQKSFFDNCSHKMKHDGTAWKEGGQGRYMRDLKPFIERAMGIVEYNAMTYTHYPNKSVGWLRLAHLYDVEREWVCIGLAYSTLEQTFKAKNEHADLIALRHLKRRHFENAPEHIKFYVSSHES